MQLTYDNILALAPDAGTAQRARTVAHAQRWLTLEGTGRSIWGTLGNPADPYRTQVDFQGPAFQCSCPVRRQPCKHGIGLLLLFFKNNDAFRVVDEPPDWVTSWLLKRAARSANPNSAGERPAEVNEALAEKRRQNREKRMFQMAAGLAELESWLSDLFRQGLSTLEGKAGEFWNELATRMVDAKLGTIARRLRQLPLLMTYSDWHEKILAELGDIYLIVKAFQRIEQLPEPLQDDLLTLSGVNLKKEDILAQPGLNDKWLVAGQTEMTEENNLLARYTWLAGESTGKIALLLDFSWGGQGFDTHYRMGAILTGEVVFYPSAYPQRGLLKSFEYIDQPFTAWPGYSSLEIFAGKYALALSANPWVSHFPAFLEAVIPVYHKGEFILVDHQHKQLPLRADENSGWKLIALSGGKPLRIFGVWNDEKFLPLSTIISHRFYLLHAAGQSGQPLAAPFFKQEN